MRVLAYVRVSTDEQADEGFSLPAQRQRIADFVRSQWPAAAEINWYIDDGFSAKNLDRPHLQELRRDAAAGDVVMVLRLDRLTRSVLDLYTLLKEWEHRGVFFRSVTEPYDTQKPEGRFMIGLLALLAEWERLRIGERVREVMAHTVQADRCHLSRPPLGYDLVDGRLVVNPAEAAIVREVFDLYLTGLSLRAVARSLSQRGLRTKGHAEWTDFAVRYVLQNPVYTGRVAWQRRTAAICVDGTHEPLLPAAVWEAAQARMAGRERRTGRAAAGVHPLTGLAVCGLCGGPMHGVAQRRHTYYRCSRREHRGGCALPYVRAAELEGRVVAALAPLAATPSLQGIAAALLPAGGGGAAQALRRLEATRRRWAEAYAAGAIALEEWRRRDAEAGARAAALQAALAEEPPPVAAVAAAMRDLPAVWAALTPAERRTLAHGLVDRIIVGADRSATVQLRPSFF